MKIEIAVPCYNEEQTVAKVVKDFRAACPAAEVVVYDNNSTDRTAVVARQAGARVIPVRRKGKGCVVREMFARTPADILVMVDGDDTYEARDIDKLMAPILSQEADMVVGTRLHAAPGEFRRLHHWGNRVMTGMMNVLFRSAFTDMLSGYRAVNREVIECLALISTDFEIESELTIKAVTMEKRIKEIPIGYRNRPPGNPSKLNTSRDGYRVLLMIIGLLRDYRPFFLFSLSSLLLIVLGGTLTVAYWYGGGHRLWSGWAQKGAWVCGATAFGLFLAGLILNTINVRFRELNILMKRRHHGGS